MAEERREKSSVGGKNKGKKNLCDLFAKSGPDEWIMAGLMRQSVWGIANWT